MMQHAEVETRTPDTGAKGALTRQFIRA